MESVGLQGVTGGNATLSARRLRKAEFHRFQGVLRGSGVGSRQVSGGIATFSASRFLPLVPKVSEALWERRLSSKLGFPWIACPRGVCASWKDCLVRSRSGNGVSAAAACPKRFANFGHERREDNFW